MRRTTVIILAAVTAAALGACSDTKRPLETAVHSPDAYATYRPADLNLPPDYARRPSKDDAKTRAVATARPSARFGRGRGPEIPADWRGLSRGTQAMLMEMNAHEADDSIRETLNADTTIYSSEKKEFGDRLLFGDVPAAAAESNGKTLAVARKSVGLIGKVF